MTLPTIGNLISLIIANLRHTIETCLFLGRLHFIESMTNDPLPFDVIYGAEIMMNTPAVNSSSLNEKGIIVD